MKLFGCLLMGLLAMAAPAQALLGAKLALLGAVRSNFGGSGILGGFGNGGAGYGNGVSSNGFNYNRPVYTGQISNYGWGQRNYGGGYSSGYGGGYSSEYGGAHSSGYAGGYNDDNNESVRVVKVIIHREQPQAYYDTYARSSAAASAANWSPTPTSTYIPQPVQSIQVSAPASVNVPVAPAVQQTIYSEPVQSTQYSRPAQIPAISQVIQPPPTPFYVQGEPQPQYIQRLQPTYQQANIQKPIQYGVLQTIDQQQQYLPPARPLPQPQQTVSAFKLIVDGDAQHIPPHNYGPPPPVTAYVTPAVGNTGAWNSDSWSTASSGNGLNGAANTGSWKNGGIWTKIGC